MTTPITQQAPQHQAIPVASPSARREWCCGTPVTEPHIPGCAYEAGAYVDDAEPVNSVSPVEPSPEPPPAPHLEVPAAASRRSGYGFRKLDEADLELPSGSLVRYRKLSKGHLLKMNLIEVLDGFTPELLADVRSGDEDRSNDAALKALTDPERNAKIFGPIDRVVVAAVVIPTVVLVGPTSDSQVNIDDVELEDKITIFSAALGEQLDALKSVRIETPSGV